MSDTPSYPLNDAIELRNKLIAVPFKKCVLEKP